MQELEQKCKEAENKRSTLIFDFEKERAKWNFEKEMLNGQKTEAQEHAERLEKKKEQLLKENERLKNDLKNSRKMMYQRQGTEGPGSYQRFASGLGTGGLKTSVNRLQGEKENASGDPPRPAFGSATKFGAAGLSKEGGIGSVSKFGAVSSSMSGHPLNLPLSKPLGSALSAVMKQSKESASTSPSQKSQKSMEDGTVN